MNCRAIWTAPARNEAAATRHGDVRAALEARKKTLLTPV
jgi:hypothetical protein